MPTSKNSRPDLPFTKGVFYSDAGTPYYNLKDVPADIFVPPSVIESLTGEKVAIAFYTSEQELQKADAVQSKKAKAPR